MPERGFWPMLSPKYADHLPLYRQSGNIPQSGRGADTVAELLEPLCDVLRQYVLMPGKVHADDIPRSGPERSGKTERTGWVYVRDDRNAGRRCPGGLVRVQSGPERYPSTESSGRLQRCASGRYLRWLPGVIPTGRITEAACMAHARGKSTICMQERQLTSPRKPCSVSVNCMPSRQKSGDVQQNKASGGKKARAAPLMEASLYDWIQTQMKTLSRHSDAAKRSPTC